MTWCSASFTRLVRSRVPCVDHQYISLVAVAQWIALALLKCVPPMRALLLPQQVQKWPALMLPQESLSSKISTDIPFRGPTPFPLTMFHGPDIKWVWVWDWDSFTNQNFGCFWYHLVSSKRKRTANFETKLLMGLSHAMPRLQWTRPVKRHTSHHPNAWRSARLGKAVVPWFSFTSPKSGQRHQWLALCQSSSHSSPMFPLVSVTRVNQHQAAKSQKSALLWTNKVWQSDHLHSEVKMLDSTHNFWSFASAMRASQCIMGTASDERAWWRTWCATTTDYWLWLPSISMTLRPTMINLDTIIKSHSYLCWLVQLYPTWILRKANQLLAKLNMFSLKNHAMRFGLDHLDLSII